MVIHELQLTSIARGGEWSFKNSGSRKILVEYHGSRRLVFQRLCASRSLDFSTKLSQKSQFVPLSVFINDVFRLHLILNFNEATYKFS